MSYVRYQLAGLRLWALLLVLAVVQVAHAQGTATGTRYFAKHPATGNEPPIGSGNPHATAQAACSYSLSLAVAQWGVAGGSAVVNGLICTLSGTTNNGTTPFNYQYTIRTDTGSIALPCPDAGTKKIINVTAGYVTSANGSADVLGLPSLVTKIGQTMCASAFGSSCTYTIGQPVNSWSSTQPTTTGLYRISDDWEMVATGASCTPTANETAQTDATAAPPSCPGAYGTVNGKPVCVPTAGGTSSRPAASTTNRAGNPAAGSDGTSPVGNRSPSTGTNNANNGSSPAGSDGTPIGARDTGIPAAAGTASGSGSGSVTVDLSNIPTDCDKHPSSVGCSEFGTPDNSVSLGNQDSGFSSITPVPFVASSGCPAPLSFTVGPGTYFVQFTPICENAEGYIKPVVLILGAALAAFVFVGGFRS